MKSQFEIVKAILEDASVNWLKVDYFKRAKFDMAAWFRTQTGETVDTGGIKKGHFMASRMTGSKSPSLLLTIARETGSRNEEGSYDHRSMILAALALGGGTVQNVSEIHINRNFTKGFESVNLNGLPVFPEFVDDEAEKEFAKHFIELQINRAKKDLLSKQMDAMKKKLDKKAEVKRVIPSTLKSQMERWIPSSMPMERKFLKSLHKSLSFDWTLWKRLKPRLRNIPSPNL